MCMHVAVCCIVHACMCMHLAVCCIMHACKCMHVHACCMHSLSEQLSCMHSGCKWSLQYACCFDAASQQPHTERVDPLASQRRTDTVGPQQTAPRRPHRLCGCSSSAAACRCSSWRLLGSEGTPPLPLTPLSPRAPRATCTTQTARAPPLDGTAAYSVSLACGQIRSGPQPQHSRRYFHERALKGLPPPGTLSRLRDCRVAACHGAAWNSAEPSKLSSALRPTGWEVGCCLGTVARKVLCFDSKPLARKRSLAPLQSSAERRLPGCAAWSD